MLSSCLKNCMYYVYILKSTIDKTLYIGHTSDLRRRFADHNSGRSIYTKHKKPWILVYYEAYHNKKDAVSRERRLKKYKGAYASLKTRIQQSIDES